LYAQQVNLFGMRAVLCLLPAPYILTEAKRQIEVTK
jgi:hypothetical protein